MGDVSPRTYYDRQLRVPGWGKAGQDALGRATVLVVGVGGLGCPVLGSLARSGVGRLVFCDPDRVEASNLPRQTLFSIADVGAAKVDAAARALAAANPWITLEPRQERVDASNVRALVEAADLVVDGTDNFATKFLVHDACRSAGKPLVMASLYQWEAQVTVFPFHKPGPGCWRCLWPEAPEDGCVGVCADVGVAGALAGVAGHFQALAAVRLLLDLEGPEPCAAWIVDAADWTPRRLKWKPDPACACSRGPGDWSWLTLSAAAGDRTLEARWPEVAADDRQVVVDIREPEEIATAEWDFFRSCGSEVVHFPWTRWRHSAPVWEPHRTYLIVCARGIRSLAAVRTVPDHIRALSLTGGVAELEAQVSTLR
jgi:adenylyltransferase/sulfurtransferase